jgi:hypothetical protein
VVLDAVEGVDEKEIRDVKTRAPLTLGDGTALVFALVRKESYDVGRRYLGVSRLNARDRGVARGCGSR